MKYFLFGHYGHDSKRAILYSSIFGSISAILLTQPLWVTLTRTQLNVKQAGYKNLQSCVVEIYDQHGLRGYYRGLQLSIMLSIHGIIQMNAYEFMMRVLRYALALAFLANSSTTWRPSSQGSGRRV